MPGRQIGARLVAEGLALRYGDRHVLQGIDLAIEPGEVVALLGPSGCGKTTLLRLVAGLATPTSGRLLLDGREIARPGWALPPERRGLGMVFQDYALWPHLTVLGNVRFPLQMRRVPRRETIERARAALAQVGLAALAEQRPAQLSGGQQQRVALARALVARPALLLFDEPLSNLDRDLREELCGEIRQRLRESGATALYVTHDRHEADVLADRVIQLREGRVTGITVPKPPGDVDPPSEFSLVPPPSAAPRVAVA